MKRRLFLAINLPSETKALIGNKFPAFADQSEKWHLTLVFLGYQEDRALAAVSAACKKTVSGFEMLEIELNKTVYGPSEKNPRMLWLINENQKDGGLGPLVENLKENLLAEGVKFKLEDRPYLMHLTLVR